MRRIALLLSLLLLSNLLLSCSTLKEVGSTEETIDFAEDEKSSQEAKGTMETATESYAYPQVCDKLSWEKINSFPIASPDMSTDELRALCVDFFRFCQSFAWTPSEQYQYTVRSKSREITLDRGVVYGGLPYVTSGRGNIYRLMEFYDEETGVVDIKNAGAVPELFGNQCSFGAFWAWARVVNSVNFGSTARMVEKNGYLPLGPYTYDTSIEAFGDITTPQICEENGQEVMFRSYALLKPGDGLVNSNSAGHVIMASSEAHVEYGADGTIDGEKSYFTYIHQASSWSDGVQSDGSPYRTQTVTDIKKTFNETFSEHYIPFTLPELIGREPVEGSETTSSHTLPTITPKELQAISIASNYAISDLYLTIADEEGNQVYYKAIRSSKIDEKTITPGSSVYAGSLEKFADGNHKVTIICQLGTGERPVAYTGIIVAAEA